MATNQTEGAHMKLKDFSKLDTREARRLALSSLPANHRGSFAVKPKAPK